MDAAIPTRVAVQSHKAVGQEPEAEEGKFHRNLVRAAEEREHAACKNFEVSKPANAGTPSGTFLDTPWAPTCKMVEGKRVPT